MTTRQNLVFGLLLLTSASSFAADKYSCQVIGQFTNMDKETATVDVDGLIVEANAASATLFGRKQAPEYEWDTRSEVMPWAISIKNKQDGGKRALVLTLRAPNQNASVGAAYADGQSQYIGFVFGSSLEALCIKL